MPNRRRAPPSPRKRFKSTSTTRDTASALTTPKRSGLRPAKPTKKKPLYASHSGAGSSDTSDSESSSGDEALSLAAQREKAYGKYARDFGFLTPETSAQSSFSGSSYTQSSVRLLDLPVEVHQHICNCLATDRDIANYALACKETNECVTSSVWRKRFLCHFDPIEHATLKEIYQQYSGRRALSHLCIEFHLGHHPLHRSYLLMLRDLIVQSDASRYVDRKGNTEIYGHNHNFIRQLTNSCGRVIRSHGTNIVDTICKTDALFPSNRHNSSRAQSSLVLIIQLCLLHVCLDPFSSFARAARFHESQQHVYRSRRKEPIFIGRNKEEINLPWLLHVANFFKFHFKQPGGEGMLAHSYGQLPENERPRPWCGKLTVGTQELCKSWKGAYAYLNEHELEAIRNEDNAGRDLLVDETSEDNQGFQDLTLFFDIETHPELHFADRLEEVLHGRPFGPLYDHMSGEASVPQIKDFFGLGYGGMRYHFNGRLHAMPPQQGIPGFQRVTMMKFLPGDNGVYGFGQTTAWAYEGCVLPGNEIMIGRWWRVESDPEQEADYSGPFIFWGVEGTAEDKAKDITAALKFMDVVGNSMAW